MATLDEVEERVVVVAVLVDTEGVVVMVLPCVDDDSLTGPEEAELENVLLEIVDVFGLADRLLEILAPLDVLELVDEVLRTLEILEKLEVAEGSLDVLRTLDGLDNVDVTKVLRLAIELVMKLLDREVDVDRVE